MTVRKSELISMVMERARVIHKEAADWVECVLDCAVEAVIRDGQVSVWPLGQVNVTYSAGRPHSLGLCPSNWVVQRIRAMEAKS